MDAIRINTQDINLATLRAIYRQGPKVPWLVVEVTEDQVGAVKALPNFFPQSYYASLKPIRADEIGACECFRFLPLVEAGHG